MSNCASTCSNHTCGWDIQIVESFIETASSLCKFVTFKYPAPGVQIGPYNPSGVVNKYEWKVILLTFTMAVTIFSSETQTQLSVDLEFGIRTTLLQNISKELHLSRISR
ncbi:hypothetical protein Tsp_09679 [Trichinella spiralis]|uniref:hypothetical protein n=1 Tax=Trichinella spiralis TaxID=6334 RepID=UPI0001EFD32A|nr:hypothetical protein Tsp_09679 [Trichinella spiralis]